MDSKQVKDAYYLRHLIADVLEKHDGICLDDDGDRLRLLDALCEALSKPAN